MIWYFPFFFLLTRDVQKEIKLFKKGIILQNKSQINLNGFHNLEIKAISEYKDKVFVEVAMDLNFKNVDRVSMEQVVQLWEQGQIVDKRLNII